MDKTDWVFSDKILYRNDTTSDYVYSNLKVVTEEAIRNLMNKLLLFSAINSRH